MNFSSRYSQIAAHYKHLIDNHHLTEGDAMPTDKEIEQLFNVSRITARQAMSELVNAGYIERIQGKGTFVRIHKADLQLNNLQGFTEEMRAKGLEASSQILDISVEHCDKTVAGKLQIEKGSKVYSIKRLRLANNIPMAIEHLRIPYDLCPDLDTLDMSISLYGQLAEHYGLIPVSAIQNIEANIADVQTQKLMHLRPHSPALFIERISFLRNSSPLEYVLSVYRGDRYTFSVRMNRL